MFPLRHDQDAELVKEKEREGDDKEREGVAGRGEDGREDEDDHDGDAPAPPEYAPAHDAEMPEDGQHRRELEQQAHQEDHGREDGDIGVQREGVDHRGADLIVVEKDQQHRHDDKIADGDPEIEQPAA